MGGGGREGSGGRRIIARDGNKNGRGPRPTGAGGGRGTRAFGLNRIANCRAHGRSDTTPHSLFYSAGLFFHVVGEGVVNLARKAENVTDKENYIDFRLRLLGEPGELAASCYDVTANTLLQPFN